MMNKEPLLYKTKVADLTRSLTEELGRLGWQQQKEGAGWALVQLFGHLVQVISHRLNQVPRQHFRAFLNESLIDQLPPQAAGVELTFTPTPDSPPVIRVAQGVQVATRPSETQAEIVFETARPITVVPALLAHCLAVDPVNYRDCTAQANGPQTGAFPAFQGEQERTRILYIGHDELFTFPDDASRHHTTLTLQFIGEPPVEPVNDQWRLQFLSWQDDHWVDLQTAGALVEGDRQLRQDGKIKLSRLPVLSASNVNGVESVWLACQLTGGVGRRYLPVLQRVELSRTITSPAGQAIAVVPNAAVAAIQAGTVFVPLVFPGPLMPFGTQPTGLDAFYLQLDEALTKAGAKVTLDLTVEGVPVKPEDASAIDQLQVQWEYFSTDPANGGWQPLGASGRGCPPLENRNFEATAFGPPTVRTNPLTRRKYLEFAIPAAAAGQPLPPAFHDGTVTTDIFTGRAYVQLPVPEAYTNLPDTILINGCSTAVQPGFKDKTCALTTSGTVQLIVPATLGAVTVNGQHGYWIRARLLAGSYDVPQRATGLLTRLTTQSWLPPKSFPPVIKAFQATYAQYHSETPPQPVHHCHSRIDMRIRDHAADLAAQQPFRPFTTADEEPALYLGFTLLRGAVDQPAFPVGEWIELRVTVQETAAAATPTDTGCTWDYWNGSRWAALNEADGTHGLTRSGYVGFFAPADQQPSVEFGKQASWVRVRPAATTGTAAVPMPYLETIRLNTVQAINAETISEELLGSSNGEPEQQFRLAYPPVLPDLQIEVREPKQSEDADSEALPTQASATATTLSTAVQATTATTTATTTASTATEQLNNEAWIPWQMVSTFQACQPESRCYLLDPIRGELRFGDGVRGKIPPPGRDNIRARRYCTHRAVAGNVGADAITVLRNPKGDLGQIRGVTNPWLAASGQDAETVEEVEERGPYRLKNRQRAVTEEDFAWLAREVDGVADAHCLPARDAQGQPQPGWVTLVITPKPSHVLADQAATKPMPTPALLRQVQAYVEARALSNLTDETQTAAGQPNRGQLQDTDRILVKGPAYLEVTVQAKVVATEPAQAAQVRLAIIQRLRDFLQPLTGGPDRQGWTPGRSVYRSEVAAEIEQTPGVDHVAEVQLLASSRLQQRLHLVNAPKLAWTMPTGSQVSTFDEQLKLILAARCAQGETPGQLPVYGFNRGDEVNLVGVDWPTVKRRTAQLAATGFTLLFDRPLSFDSMNSFAHWLTLAPALVGPQQTAPTPVKPYLFRPAQDGTITLLGVLVQGIIADLHVDDPVDIVPVGQPMTLLARRQVAQRSAPGFTVSFDQPVTFANSDNVQQWERAAPALLSNDERIRLPLQPCALDPLTGQLQLAGVTLRSFAAGDLISLTHGRNAGRAQADLGPVQAVMHTVSRRSALCAGGSPGLLR
ncbi:MAG: baseplate J/gp47 family protein [Caldilineaceae bacterium]